MPWPALQSNGCQLSCRAPQNHSWTARWFNGWFVVVGYGVWFCRVLLSLIFPSFFLRSCKRFHLTMPNTFFLETQGSESRDIWFGDESKTGTEQSWRELPTSLRNSAVFLSATVACPPSYSAHLMSSGWRLLVPNTLLSSDHCRSHFHLSIENFSL